MAPRRRSFLRSPGSRRRTDWSDGPGASDGTNLQLTASGQSGVGVGQTPIGEEVTIIRTRGILSLSLGLATSANDGFWGALGIGITTVQAFTDVGITALPIPLDDVFWDGWLYHTFFDIRSSVASSTANAGVNGMMVLPIDSKASRKLQLNEVVFMVVQVVETGTAVVNIHAATRMLLKLA